MFGWACPHRLVYKLGEKLRLSADLPNQRRTMDLTGILDHLAMEAYQMATTSDPPTTSGETVSVLKCYVMSTIFNFVSLQLLSTPNLTPISMDPWTPGPLDSWTPGPMDSPGPMDPWTSTSGEEVSMLDLL